MADIVYFSQYAWEPGLDAMSREELLSRLENVRSQIEQLDIQEPENVGSGAHDSWGDLHEDLEDLADEILDLLDERGAGGD